MQGPSDLINMAIRKKLLTFRVTPTEKGNSLGLFVDFHGLEVLLCTVPAEATAPVIQNTTAPIPFGRRKNEEVGA